MIDAERIRCTSICHCKHNNYQIDHFGNRHACADSFNRWCVKNGVIWGLLFNEVDGTQIASFSKDSGLNLTETV